MKIERKLPKIPDPPRKESFAARQISMLLDNRYAFRMFTSDYQEYLMLKARCLSGCGYYKEAFPIYKVVWLNVSSRSDSFVDRYLILDELVHSATTHSDLYYRSRTRRPEGQVDGFSPRKGFFLVRGRYALMDPQGDRNGP